MLEIATSDYRVSYEKERETIAFEGTFRLSGSLYAPISEMLTNILAEKPSSLRLDLTELKFLNSSGINVLAKFTILVRNSGNVAMSVVGSQKIPWQEKSLPNLKKLYPALELSIV
ncbi:MAG: hypothetical protein EOL87_06890 [Spartobacteria bacterium]|nr:hypothetical protein [Spartobacteria bacterium]